MQTLILPDIHLNWRKANKIIAAESPDRVICLGDYFDDYGDSPEQNLQAAIWLRGMLDNENFIALIGNHCLGYKYDTPHICSGFSETKKKAINSVMTHKYWSKLKWFYILDDWLLTHAGLSPHFLPPFFEVNLDNLSKFLETEAEKAEIALKTGGSHWFFRAGKSRDGEQEVGGILWCDFNNEFEPLEDIKQVMGHTIMLTEQMETMKFSSNICLDSCLNYYAVYQNGDMTIKNFLDL